MEENILGAITGFSQVIIGHPFDTIKTNMQINKKINISFFNLYKGVKYPIIGNSIVNSASFGINDIVYKHSHSYWISGLVSGAVTSIIVNPFELYKVKNQVLTCTKNNGSIFKGLSATFLRESIAMSIYFGTYFSMNEEYNSLISGGIAGLFAWTFSYPLDVIKSRIQTNQALNIIDSIKQKNLWKGYSLCATRAIIVNSFGFYVYDLCKQNLF